MATSLDSPGGVFSVGSASLYDGTTGSLILHIPNPTPDFLDVFGALGATAVGGNFVISAPLDDYDGYLNAGSVYLYDGSTGELVQSIRNPAPAITTTNASFGFPGAMAIGGNFIVADSQDDPGGSVYVFDGATGALLEAIANPFPPLPSKHDGDRFGVPQTAAVGDGNFVVMAQYDDPNGVPYAGSVYFYSPSRPPLAQPMSSATVEDVALALTLAGHDPGGGISYSIVTPPLHGVLSGTLPNVVYAPMPNQNGLDEFIYRVTDSIGFLTDATVRINVMPVNDAPAAGDDAVVALEDTAIPISVLANDVDVDGNALAVTVTNAPLKGTTQVVAAVVTYTPNANATGSDSFVYAASDGTLSGSATVSITIVPVSDGGPSAPVIFAPPEGALISTIAPMLSVTNATDPDGELLQYEFQLDVSTSFIGVDLQTSGQVAPGAGTTSWTAADLLEDTRYFWRARASDGTITSDWSLGSFFASQQNDVPSAPLALTPVDVLTLTATPTLTIENATDPEADVLTYEFEVRHDSETGALVASSPGVSEGEGRTSWVTDPVPAGRRLIWRARADDGNGGVGTWSAAAPFEANKDETGCGCKLGPTTSKGVSRAIIALLALFCFSFRRYSTSRYSK